MYEPIIVCPICHEVRDTWLDFAAHVHVMHVCLLDSAPLIDGWACPCGFSGDCQPDLARHLGEIFNLEDHLRNAETVSIAAPIAAAKNRQNVEVAIPQQADPVLGACLTVAAGHRVETYRLRARMENVIGRIFTTDGQWYPSDRLSHCIHGIPCEDSSCSRVHAAVVYRGGRWVVSDLSSRNGTYLNSERIDAAILTDGDLIQMGDTVFTFRQMGPERGLDWWIAESLFGIESPDDAPFYSTNFDDDHDVYQYVMSHWNADSQRRFIEHFEQLGGKAAYKVGNCAKAAAGDRPLL